MIQMSKGPAHLGVVLHVRVTICANRTYDAGGGGIGAYGDDSVIEVMGPCCFGCVRRKELQGLRRELEGLGPKAKILVSWPCQYQLRPTRGRTRRANMG